MQCAAIDQFSYAEVTVSANQLGIELLDQNGDPVRDTGNRADAASAPPCGAITIPKQ
jgi:hypothetical protein